MRQLKNIILSLLAVISITALATTNYAFATTALGTACDEKINENSVVCVQQKNAAADTSSLLGKIVEVLMFALGAICVIMIIIGGIRYTTSGGDASQVKSAKDTILYSVVGLVVAIFAYAIVGFVIKSF